MAPAQVDLADDSTADIAPDALSVLARDHRLAEELFTEFERSAPQQLDPLARRICKMLRVHAQIEEELFYPAVRRALTSEEFLDTAAREHRQAQASIARIESMTSDDPEFKAAVAMLSQQVAEHARKEEQELFAQVRSASLDLTAIGIALSERRDTLLDVLGLHDDDEEGAANQRETRQPSTSAARAAANPEGR